MTHSVNFNPQTCFYKFVNSNKREIFYQKDILITQEPSQAQPGSWRWSQAAGAHGPCTEYNQCQPGQWGLTTLGLGIIPCPAANSESGLRSSERANILWLVKWTVVSNFMHPIPFKYTLVEWSYRFWEKCQTVHCPQIMNAHQNENLIMCNNTVC